MRLARIPDIPAVAALLNDPSIRPHIGGEGELNPTALVIDRRNRCWFDDRGGGLFAWRGPGIFEAHIFFKVRGREALEAFAEVMEQMADARMIWGLIPIGNRRARWFGRRVGFASHGMMDAPDLGRCELFVRELSWAQE